MKKGVTHAEIAADLNRSQSSISREITRNTGQRGYRHKQAHQLAPERHATMHKARKMTGEITDIIDDYVQQEWTPEQVAGRLEQEGVVSLHHETICRYILADKRAGGDIYTHLRHQNKTCRKRYGAAYSRHGIPNRVDIDERPDSANTRERVDDWEADTMIGKNHRGVFVTLDERKSKLRLAMPVSSKKRMK